MELDERNITGHSIQVFVVMVVTVIIQLEHIKTLEKIQKRALKCCRNNSPLKWDTLTDRRTRIRLCAMFKTYRGSRERRPYSNNGVQLQNISVAAVITFHLLDVTFLFFRRRVHRQVKRSTRRKLRVALIMSLPNDWGFNLDHLAFIHQSCISFKIENFFATHMDNECVDADFGYFYEPYGEFCESKEQLYSYMEKEVSVIEKCGGRTKVETSEVLCVECSILRGINMDSVRVSVESGMSDDGEDKEGRRGNPVPFCFAEHLIHVPCDNAPDLVYRYVTKNRDIIRDWFNHARVVCFDVFFSFTMCSLPCFHNFILDIMYYIVFLRIRFQHFLPRFHVFHSFRLHLHMFLRFVIQCHVFRSFLLHHRVFNDFSSSPSYVSSFCYSVSCVSKFSSSSPVVNFDVFFLITVCSLPFFHDFILGIVYHIVVVCFDVFFLITVCSLSFFHNFILSIVCHIVFFRTSFQHFLPRCHVFHSFILHLYVILPFLIQCRVFRRFLLHRRVLIAVLS
ncbi:hypothetical protein ANN_23295 [Periplaneta americana]|uniref:Uncharacterized protein n=1 Tax=Periplaneta americana TaxID=6978 RepID=A0ABQ8SKS5_PERAM|nr:hypothetical protein ANN_23295 [Periplaneta americana]